MFRTALLAGAALAMAGGIAGAKDMSEQVPVPEVNASNAKIEGNTIMNISASIDRPGFLVIHNNGAGAPPASLGHIALQPGTTGNLNIKADGPLDPDSGITLMLHYDTNHNNTYDFGPGSTDVDTPVMGGDKPINVPVMASKM